MGCISLHVSHNVKSQFNKTKYKLQYTLQYLFSWVLYLFPSLCSLPELSFFITTEDPTVCSRIWSHVMHQFIVIGKVNLQWIKQDFPVWKLVWTVYMINTEELWVRFKNKVSTIMSMSTFDVWWQKDGKQIMPK